MEQQITIPLSAFKSLAGLVDQLEIELLVQTAKVRIHPEYFDEGLILIHKIQQTISDLEPEAPEPDSLPSGPFGPAKPNPKPFPPRF